MTCSQDKRISVSSWFCSNLRRIHLLIFQEVSSLVLAQNIGNLENVLRSHLVLVLRLKKQDYQSWSQSRPFVNFLRSLILSLVTKYWSCHYLIMKTCFFQKTS